MSKTEIITLNGHPLADEIARGLADDLDRSKAPAIECAASGGVIAVSDASDGPLRGLRVFGKTAQDGTPAPDAPVEPVNAGAGGVIGLTVCGKNLFTSDWEQGDVNIVGVPENNGSVIRTKDYVPVSPGGTYSIKRTIGGSFVKVRGYDANKTFVGSGETIITLIEGQEGSSSNNPMNGDGLYCTIKVAESVAYLKFCDLTNDLASKYMMVLGSGIPTEYEPYIVPQSLSLSAPGGLPGLLVASGGNYADENGQMWLCDEVDFEKGVYIKRVGAKRGAELTWSINTTWSDTNGSGIFGFAKIADMKNGVLLSNTFKHREFTASATRWSVGEASIEKDTVLYALISNAVEATPAAFAAYMAEIDAVFMYQLITPVETPLSAEAIAAYRALRIHKPDTTVFSDAGAGLELTYAADTKLYIDNRFAELAAAIVNNA